MAFSTPLQRLSTHRRSSATTQPVQLQFDFMDTMPPQLSPAAVAREFTALHRAFGGGRCQTVSENSSV